ncbi:hypothetical protein [Pandoraea bronchicola]|nr:hypothetical protein [Pandoraea bronchicola]
MTPTFHVNKSLVIRSLDRCLFNPKTFTVLRMNASGFGIVQALQGKDFSHAEFMAAYRMSGRSDSDADRFLDKCLKHQLFVPMKLPEALTANAMEDGKLSSPSHL